jgi:hypothetical protein
LERIEELKKPVDDGKITVRFAYLRMLPHTYVGEKHEVLVQGYPSEDPHNGCVIQEYPGPGPELKFDFPKARRTLLVRFLEADGDGVETSGNPEVVQ